MYNFETFFELFIIFIKVYNIPIQPKQIPTYYNDHTNLKINQYILESKCKKIVTVVAVLSPSSICVILEDSNTNVSWLLINCIIILLTIN